MATIGAVLASQMDPWIEYKVALSGMTAGETVQIPVPTKGTTCNAISHMITTSATDGSPVVVTRKTASDVKSVGATTQNYVGVKVDTIPGGSLDGMVLEVRMRFDAMAANAIDATPTL